MAKINYDFSTPPPDEYDPVYYEQLVSALLDALNRVDYSVETDSVARMGLDWIGL